jgi:hypothetical protein
MIQKKMLLTMYEYSYFLVNQATEGITNPESMILPPRGDNPANWILGHIMASRFNVMAMLKLEPPWDKERCDPYLPNSKPLSEEDEVEDFGEMKEDLEKTQESLTAAIQDLINQDLETIVSENSLGEELAGYAIHEVFHAGELGIIQKFLTSK